MEYYSAIKESVGLTLERINGMVAWKDLRYTTLKDHVTPTVHMILSPSPGPTECPVGGCEDSVWWGGD